MAELNKGEEISISEYAVSISYLNLIYIHSSTLWWQQRIISYFRVFLYPLDDLRWQHIASQILHHCNIKVLKFYNVFLIFCIFSYIYAYIILAFSFETAYRGRTTYALRSFLSHFLEKRVFRFSIKFDGNLTSRNFVSVNCRTVKQVLWFQIWTAEQ